MSTVHLRRTAIKMGRRWSLGLALPLLLATAGAAGGTVIGAAVVAPTARAAAACSGVAVVVDYRSLGGGAQTGCAPGDPTSGLAAMRSAGFTPAFSPSGLVCQINGKPDPCPRTPPTTAYWSYWHAKPGGSWTYSSLGAGSYDPAPGSVEGWSFGAGQPPSVAPPAAAPPPATAPSQPPPAQQPGPPQQAAPPVSGSKPATTAPNGAQPGAAPGGSAPVEPGTGQAPSGAAGSTPAGGASSGPSTASDAAPAQDRAGPPAGGGGQGRALGLVAGLALVGGLGGLAFLTARRRSRAAAAGQE